MSYQPLRYTSILLIVLTLCFVVVAVALSGAPWWVLLGVAVLVLAATLLMAFALQWARMERCTYATPDARLAIVSTPRGWYLADHVIRPGATLEGHRLRLHVRDALTTVADARQIIVYAHTKDERLARIYMRCVPGMRIAARRRKRILLVRVPRQPVDCSD